MGAALAGAHFPRRASAGFPRVPDSVAMMKRLFLLLFTVALVACSRPALTGRYQSQGSEDKFKMVLELADAGAAKFVTKANLGDPKLDRAVEATMGIPSGRWTKEGGEIAVTGPRGDGKPMTHRFFIQENGDLIWKENGARFVKAP
jgi:hypothetical protein